jgi:hypothetical protein
MKRALTICEEIRATAFAASMRVHALPVFSARPA